MEKLENAKSTQGLEQEIKEFQNLNEEFTLKPKGEK